MFSSFSSFSNPFRLYRFFHSSASQAINLSSVKIHDVEISHEKGARTLKHLLKLNHVNHSIIYHQLQFHNHMPHVRSTSPWDFPVTDHFFKILGSAYLLGAEHDHLNNIYDTESKELEPWHDSPGEVSSYDWRDYLGNAEYVSILFLLAHA